AGPLGNRTMELASHESLLGPLSDGTALVTVDDEARTTHLWNLQTGQLLTSKLWHEMDQQVAQPVQFLPANQLAVGVSTNGLLHFWNLANGAHLRSIQLMDTNFLTILISPDSRWLLGTVSESVNIAYDLQTGRRVTLASDFSNAAAFSPDSRF